MPSSPQLKDGWSDDEDGWGRGVVGTPPQLKDGWSDDEDGWGRGVVGTPPQLKDGWSDDEDGWGRGVVGTPPLPDWMVPDEAELKEQNRMQELIFRPKDEPVTEADIAPRWKTEKLPLWIPSTQDLDEPPLRSFFGFSLHKIPSYLKIAEDREYIQEQIAMHSSRIPSLSYENVEGSVSYCVSYTLACFSESMWPSFRSKNCFKLGVEVAATLVYLLYPKERVLGMVKYGETTEQVNRFWEQLVIIGNQGCPVAEACKFIITRIPSDEYSLVTETHVSEMLFRYQVSLKNGSFRLPFTGVRPHEANLCPPPESLKEGSSLRSIYEVVEKMKPPAELKTDELTRLLIKIAEQEVDKKWLFNFALERVVQTPHDSGREWNSTFDRLMDVILDTVRGLVNSKILNASSPLNQLIDSKSAYRVPHEVLDLIYVAEIRRLAEGARFISRCHLFWAFYELGNGLPRHIIFPLFEKIHQGYHPPYDFYPPYDIYLISIKVADFYADKVRLENLLFVSLYCTVMQVCDLEQGKLNLMQAYKLFLLDLRRFSSNGRDPIDLRRFSSSGRDPDGPMFIIDFPGELEGGWLKFDG